MANIKATNNYVWVVRDEIPTESNGLILPSVGKEKPHTGKILSIGGLVRDANIKGGKSKTCLFHKGVGQQIDFEGAEYLILEENHIIAIV